MHLLTPLMLLSAAILGQALTPSSFLSTVDKARLKAVFDTGLATDSDIPSLSYAILGYKLLGETLPSTTSLCTSLSSASDDTSVETLYLASSAATALGCPLKLGTAAAAAVTAGQGDSATTASLFFATQADTNTGGKLNVAAVQKSLAAAIKKDDSLLSLGLAFHTAAMLDGDLAQFHDRIEDAIVQADEVDNKMLQFEGGLSVTSIVLTGAMALSSKAKESSPPISADQAVKFSNYLMSRKSVQGAKGAYHLLEAVLVMANNKHHVPVVVSLSSSVSVSAASPVVTVAVTDLAGGSPGPMTLTLDTATRLQDGAVIIAKQKMEAVAGDESQYQIDLIKSKPPAGFYELLVSAVPVKAAEKPLVGNTGVTVPVKVLTTLGVEQAELKVVEADQGTAGKTTKLNFPNKLSAKMSVDYSQRVSLTFAVKDTVAGQKMLVHQAFVRLANKETGAEIVYLAKADNNKVYAFDLDISGQAKEFGGQSGLYTASLILGDSTVTNPISWILGDIEITFSEKEDAAGPSIYSTKPEIKHLFREPEPRPSKLVSDMFTLICLSPFFIMLILWIKLGVNVNNFPVTLVSIGFHAGLGAIFTLYMYFWLQLNMFTTVKYLVLIGVVTFLCGNSLLAKIAKNKD